jgi:predicted dithiol-disulfide oxidoreductase (DUF899 family)
MTEHEVVGREEWLLARRELLAKEKDFTRLRDELSRQRRTLPWVRVDKDYVFEGPRGKAALPQLFAGRSQLIVFHFMFDPSWDAGCKSCSFWADSFNDNIVHLNQRDVSMVAISRAPLAQLQAYERRMGWSFEWYSSAGSSFNYDFAVSFTPEQREKGTAIYNYAPMKTSMSDLPGLSVFAKDDTETIFHTYSCYARGIDMTNSAYQLLDLVPKGRDEDGLAYNQSWVRRHDEYPR